MKITMKADAMSKTFMQHKQSKQLLKFKNRKTKIYRRLHQLFLYVIFLMVEIKRYSRHTKWDPKNGKKYLTALISCCKILWNTSSVYFTKDHIPNHLRSTIDQFNPNKDNNKINHHLMWKYSKHVIQSVNKVKFKV